MHGGVVTFSDWPVVYGGRCAEGYDRLTNSIARVCYDGLTRRLKYDSSNSNYTLACDGNGWYGAACWNYDVSYYFMAWLTPAGVMITFTQAVNPLLVLIPWVS